MLAVITDTANSDCGDLPYILIVYFSGGNLEFILDLCNDRFNDAALALEG